MIKSITLKSIASYDETGIQINDLKKVNFIYGTNGCGKTTISNFLHDATDIKFANCEVTWENAQEIKTLVYNKEFRKRNFGNGKLSGVFTLGQATAEDIVIIETKAEALKELKKNGDNLRVSLNTVKSSKEQLENEFKESTWTSIYKKYDTIFNEVFEGVKSKERFKEKLLSEFVSNSSTLHSIEKLKERGETIFGEAPVNISPIAVFNYDRINEIIENPIWKKNIIGKVDVDIAKLIQKLNINDWVNQGRGYIHEDNICPFCQQVTITENFKKQLESYFDETYITDLENTKSLKQEYNQIVDNLVHQLTAIEEFQKGLSNSKLSNDTFSAYLKTLVSQNAVNNEVLNNKIKEPSRSFELTPLKEQLDLLLGLINEANIEIGKHNDIVLNFRTEKTTLINDVWKLLIEEYRTQIIAFNTAKLGKETGLSKLQVQLDTKVSDYRILHAEIKHLSKNITSIQPTIDEINRLLKSYGFLNFEIVPSTEEGFYQIQRENGEMAENTLSEGEITFITFLYFLQLAKGGDTGDTVNEERILVIDDPISSLDSNVLFVVSTLIKEIIKTVKSGGGNINQILLLTHNVYFHKEVSFEGISRGAGERPHFWIIRKMNKVSKIQSYTNNNPIQSSYDLLWREIKEWNNNSGITIQNTMRRILENYFNILGNKRDDFLINKFDTAEEKDICRSLLSWINEGSHTLPDDLYIESPDDTIEKYLVIFRKIFEYSHNKGHYNMMMGITEEALVGVD